MAVESSSLSKLVPGFDFLEGLVKNAGSAIPGLGQWVAPTIDPAELDKRIQELRTVQYWLEQNARMLGATIQALEVQRMTLSTLQTMNVQMSDLRDALLVPTQQAAAPAPPARAAAAAAPKAADPPAAAPPPRAPAPAAADAEPSSSPSGAVDPMKWWGALTKQFTELASAAIQNGAAAAGSAAAAAKAVTPAKSAPARKPPARKGGAAAKKASGAAARKRA